MKRLGLRTLITILVALFFGVIIGVGGTKLAERPKTPPPTAYVVVAGPTQKKKITSIFKSSATMITNS